MLKTCDNPAASPSELGVKRIAASEPEQDDCDEDVSEAHDDAHDPDNDKTSDEWSGFLIPTGTLVGSNLYLLGFLFLWADFYIFFESSVGRKLEGALLNGVLELFMLLYGN